MGQIITAKQVQYTQYFISVKCSKNKHSLNYKETSFVRIVPPLYPSHRGPTHSPLPLRVVKTGKNYLNEEITPLGDRREI
jgi:hypothetical protein